MLNTKQRDTVEKASVNLLTWTATSLVIGSFVGTEGFRAVNFVGGTFLGAFFFGLALWINRNRVD